MTDDADEKGNEEISSKVGSRVRQERIILCVFVVASVERSIDG